MSTYYKVIFKRDAVRAFRQGLPKGMYAWTNLKAAETFLKDETEDEDQEVKDSFTIMKIDYSGPTMEDPYPDYPDTEGQEAKVLLHSVPSYNLKLVGGK